MQGAAEAERRERWLLADRMRESGREIERRWLERVTAEARERHQELPPTELQKALPDYLEGLASALRGDGALGASSADAWREVARKHALTPVRGGFDLAQLVRELRAVLSETLDPSSAGQQALLAGMTETAMTIAAKSYADARDHATRRAQAEHGTFVTHDLRNPLTTALVTVSQLRKNTELPAPADRLELLERSLTRLRDLIDSVVMAERLELEDVPVTRETLSLGEVVEEGLRAAYGQARDRGLELVVQIDPDLALHVDRQLTVSALRNLIENSLTFTEVGRVELRSEDRPDEVVLHVYDNCEGVSKEMLAIIFEPFRRAHTNKPSPRFGLAIARRSIEAQGGVIGAESSADHGCHVWLTLRKAHN
jgi:signal transduction histidine kinase